MTYIGTGNYGDIYLAEFKDPEEKNCIHKVAVKVDGVFFLCFLSAFSFSKMCKTQRKSTKSEKHSKLLDELVASTISLITSAGVTLIIPRFR